MESTATAAIKKKNRVLTAKSASFLAEWLTLFARAAMWRSWLRCRSRELASRTMHASSHIWIMWHESMYVYERWGIWVEGVDYLSYVFVHVLEIILEELIGVDSVVRQRARLLRLHRAHRPRRHARMTIVVVLAGCGSSSRALQTDKEKVLDLSSVYIYAYYIDICVFVRYITPIYAAFISV